MRSKYYLILFEINFKLYNKTKLENIIFLLKKQNYNFIYGIVNTNNINISNTDIIYINNSKYCFINILNEIKFDIDYVIHVKNPELIDFNSIINYDFNDDKITVSNDYNNICCRIIPYNIIKKIDKQYYNLNISKCDIIKCVNPKTDVKYEYITTSIETKIENNLIESQDLITIIMTCYNSESTVEDALRSIINQTYTNIEIIIIDDGSNDNTSKIINKYKQIDKRIQFIELTVNKGCYYSKNIALKNINPKTKYIAFQDSDDISLVSRISKQYSHMKKHKLLLSTVQFYENNSFKMPMISKMIHIMVFNKIGFFGTQRFGEDEHYYYRFFALFCPDYDWLKTIKYENNKIGFFKDYKYYHNINEILYIVKRHTASLTATIRNPRVRMSNELNKKYKLLAYENTSELIQAGCYLNFTNKISCIKNNQNVSISIDTPSTSIIEMILPKNVHQAYISKPLHHLKNRFLDKYNLVDFHSFKDPCVFFGMYNNEDINILKRLKNEKFIIWGGTDLDMEYPDRVAKFNIIKSIPITKHYAISSNMEKRMIKLKLKYEKIEFNLINENLFYPITLRENSIFIYNGFTPGSEHIYNEDIYKNIVKKLPDYNYIYSNTLNLPYENMPDIYKKCFIGLRLTNKDGNANMVQEMNYMNIPVVHNGDEIKSLLWKTESDIIKHILDNIPHILIIFDKIMIQSDGSTVWLFNFINLIKLYNSKIRITIKCMKINNQIKINNVKFITECTDYSQYNHIFYRINESIIDFVLYNNVTLIIHHYDTALINYYDKFKFIICNSILIKDELLLNNNNAKINILPPLINKIQNPKKNTVLTFCYSGTIKKSYKSLEMLTLFENLSTNYDFVFYLVYGKHKHENDIYDQKLNTIINKLKNNKKFHIYNDIPHIEIENIMNISHYGIVIHDESIDNKQQSTKLIEYLSHKCIPISYLTYLNCGYINKNLYFYDIKELDAIIQDILNNKIKYDDIIINNKLDSHLISNNLHIFNVSNNIIITNKVIINSDKIVITNVYKNIFNNKKVIFISNDYDFNTHSNNIKNILNKDKYTKYSCNLELNFYFNKLGDYILDYNSNIYDYSRHQEYLDLYGVKESESLYIYTKDSDYIEFNCLLEKNYSYYIHFDIEFIIPGTLFLLSITEFDDVLKDINRNLHVITNNNSNIKFSINTQKDSNFIFKIKPSSRNFSQVKFKINKFEINKIISPNKLCDKIKIINMDKEIRKYHKINRTFEINGIICERSTGVDGQTPQIQKIYDINNNLPFNEIEHKLNRKLIVSSGAVGYLYSMMNIFKEAIINNYEYIMICDDDIKLINDFLFKFNDLLNCINNRFRLLMLGSSQWDWNDIEFKNKYYHPNSSSNGSFANIYHRSTFDIIYKNIIKCNAPFDDIPMKINFNNNFCYLAYPNLVIAQLEESSIRKINKNRNYDRFKWNIKNYFSYEYDFNSKLIYKKINNRINKKLFIIGITTFNRLYYLKECVTSLFQHLNNDVDYIIIFADGNSSDKTQEYIKNLDIQKNISIYLICNYEHFIYRQSNSILKFSYNFNYDYGFLINDDILFLKNDWDTVYYNTSIKSSYDHLVFYDPNHKINTHTIKNKLLISYCDANGCQGAFFTFTKKMIDIVGYFDEENFKIRGHSHIDYTIRCCRNKFNNESSLFDIIDAKKYIKLNMSNYVSSFNNLPLFLRELYKVDLYELKRRLKVLADKNRNYIQDKFTIESD